MKPNFALSLSFEGISLLHRAFPGWNRVGDVALDSPDLPGALAILRETATQINGQEITSKLVIPNDQIKYLALDLGIMPEDARHEAIRTALEGATPYPLDDLEFDWSVEGDKTLVAAVARETLAEAEAFAESHGFGPLSFVAIPPEGQFAGEPFFGATAHAATVLAPGEQVQRDMAAIRVTGVVRLPDPGDAEDAMTEIAGEDAKTETVETESARPAADSSIEPGEQTAPETEEIAPEAEDAAPDPLPVFGHQPLDEETEAEDAHAAPEPAASILADTLPSEEDGAAETPAEPEFSASTAIDAPAETAAANDARQSEDIPAEEPQDPPESEAPAFASMRAQTDIEAHAAPALSGVQRGAADLSAPSIPMPEEDVAAAPAIEIAPGSSDEYGAPDDQDDPHELDAYGEPGALDTESEPETPDEASEQAAHVHAEERDTFGDIPPMPAIYAIDRSEAEELPEHGDAAPPRRLSALGRRGNGMASGLSGALSARAARRAEKRATKEEAQAWARAEAERETERQRMTVFGAREPEKAAAEIGGKPRYLGLVLSAVLLVFLAGVAAWASLFMDDGLSRIFDNAPETNVAALPDDAADELAIEGEEAMVPVSPDAPAPGVETASLSPEPTLQEPATTPAQPSLPHALTEREAQARYAVTGVWQRAPQAPQLPDQLTLDDFYVTSIDPQISGQDAVALPDAAALGTDQAMARVPLPAARGTRFALDDRGLVVASAEGTLSPEGFLVFAGRPQITPAALPQRLTSDAPATAEEQQEQARIAGKRPRVRPEGLIENNERETLGGLTRAELAGKRPRARPEQAAQKIEEEKVETGTEFAVIQSRKPRPRPSNIAALVERARKIEQTTEPRETTQVAAAVPRSQVTAPAAPSRANVAKAATVRNQINLRKINLIGVYGKPSSRRALVRLANGRYKKVKVGDRLDGGQVQAIGDGELRYTRRGRSVLLTMPKG